jgi:hypothetical protein
MQGPGSFGIVSQVIIVTGSQGGTGLFLYNGVPALGNPPIASITLSGVDPFDNPVQPILTIGIAGQGQTVIDSSGVIELQNATGAADIQLNPALDAIFVYQTGVNAVPAFGANGQSTYNGIKASGVVPMIAERVYNTPAQSMVPGYTYPGGGGSTDAAVTWPCVSSQMPIVGGKIDVAGFIAGTYDAAWINFCTSIPASPAHILITLGHELEAGANTYTPTQIIQMHEHAYAIFKAHAPANARYGQCFTSFTSNPTSSHFPNQGGGGPSGTGCSQWMCCTANGATSNLDYYAVDAYKGGISGVNADNTVATTAGRWLTDIQTKVPSPVIAVFETNVSSGASDSADAAWFTDIFNNFCIPNNALVMCVFYGSGTWNGAASPLTIAALQAINSVPPGTQIAISISPTGGTDTFGNTFFEGLNIGDQQGAHFGVDLTGDVFLSDASGLTKLYMNPSDTLIGVYPAGLAFNNLAESIAATAGTDPFGNGILQGFTSQVPGGGLFTNMNQGVIQFGDTLAAAAFSQNGSIVIVHTGSSGASPILAVNSPTADATNKAHTSLWMLGAPNSTPSLLQTTMFGVEGNATTFIPVEFIMCGSMAWGEFISGVPTAEIWHTLAPTLAGWAQAAASTPLQYRFLASPPNSVQITGSVSGTALAAGAITLATLPAMYSPPVNPTPAMVISSSGRTVTTDVPNLVVTTAGVMQIRNAQGATNLQFNCMFSVDVN